MIVSFPIDCPALGLFVGQGLGGETMAARLAVVEEGLVAYFVHEVFGYGAQLISLAFVNTYKLPIIVDGVDGVRDAIDERLQGVAAFEHFLLALANTGEKPGVLNGFANGAGQRSL